MSIVAAVTSFAAAGGVRIQSGQMFASDHPIVRQFPAMFATPPHVGAPSSAPVVEQATAAPGESRSTKRTPKRATKSSDAS